MHVCLKINSVHQAITDEKNRQRYTQGAFMCTYSNRVDHGKVTSWLRLLHAVGLRERSDGAH